MGSWLPPADCDGEDAKFSVSPVDPDNLWYITPQGKLHGSHLTPTDHTYFVHNKLRDYERQAEAVRSGGLLKPWAPAFDVKSPTDGLIVYIGTFPFGPAPEGYTGTLEDYRVIIWHSCKVSSIFIHMGGLAPEILKVTGQLQGGSQGWSALRGGQSIRVKAGQVIGKVGAQGIDFSVHDTRVTLEGLQVPEHYQGEAWKIHTVDPFDYFQDPVRSQLLEKNIRKAAPYGGKIDYHIKGRLVGNWFMEGTVDYGGGGSKEQSGFCGNRPCPYWNGHLSIAYDHIDPQQIRISIGAETGIPVDACHICQAVYGVKGNGPDPANIDAASGLVKYDLVAREFIDNTGIREPTRNAEDQVLGVFLAQVVDDTSIKVEVIPSRNSSQVTGFSESARLYHR
uniref:Putative peptidase family M23/M37 n=1 Tax=uncultured marine microorganism HF4000_ANIW93N21 TaxID=455527 RepID=B3T352_9ZZZZ|nr:putative peptidase family M23/M37 [uncultured marine microorganism HF4000_ANIW93N21]